MCFVRRPKPPAQQAAPVQAPVPVITPSEISPQSKESSRIAQLNRMRMGIASTIKTPMGMTGQKADLNPSPTGKLSLG